MSKQSEAKKRQDYVSKFEAGYCMNCFHYQSDIVPMKNEWHEWTEEKNKRCGIGGFAVAKKGSCSEHQFTIVEVKS